MISGMRDKDLERSLAEAADDYIRAADAKDAASDRLAALMREAYAADEKQSEILKASRHVWSVTYLRIVLGLAKPTRKKADAE
jgi:hypothetical protein